MSPPRRRVRTHSIVLQSITTRDAFARIIRIKRTDLGDQGLTLSGNSSVRSARWTKALRVAAQVSARKPGNRRRGFQTVCEVRRWLGPWECHCLVARCDEPAGRTRHRHRPPWERVRLGESAVGVIDGCKGVGQAGAFALSKASGTRHRRGDLKVLWIHGRSCYTTREEVSRRDPGDSAAGSSGRVCGWREYVLCPTVVGLALGL